jgi:PAS domain S-box-containing protein
MALAGWPIMRRLPALFFLLSGISFFLLGKPLLPRAAGYVLALLVLLGAGYRPGDLPFMTALCFILSSVVLLLMPSKGNKGQLAGQSLAVILFFLSLFSTLGHLFRVNELHEVPSYPLFIPVPDSACFLLFSLGCLFAGPGKGIMKDLTTKLSGGIHARLLIPIVILVPVLLGYLRLYGYWMGIFSTEFGVTILVTSIIVVFLGVVRYSTLLLNKRDRQNQKIKQDLLASQDQMGLVISNIQNYAILMVNTSGIILTWNKGAEKIKGYVGAEVIGKPISIFYSTEDNEKQEPARNLEMAGIHGHYNSEGWRIRKDGSRFWADIVFTAVYDEQGQLKGFLKITRDRTEFKKTQEQIVYQARFMEDTTDAVFSTDKDYAIQSWNKAAEKLYGYSSKEVIGSTLKEVARPIISEDMRFSIRDQLLTHGYWTGEVLHQTKNGVQLILLISASATHDEQGEVDGYVLVCRDISDRKREEQRLQRFNLELEAQVQRKTAELFVVFERVSDGFMAFDNSGEITYLNKMAAELNKRKPEEMIGKNFWQLFPSAIGNEFGENFHRAIDTQQNIHFEMFSPSLQLWIECYMYPSTDGLSLFFRDITERRKAEEAISRSSEELRQLASHLQNIREEERAAMAREIHDELGQQLTGLKMDLAWMVRKLNKPADDPLMVKITGALGLLDNTIKTVRRIATELRPSILDDLGLIAAIEWQSQEFQQRSGITVAFQSSVNEFHFEPAPAIGLFRICQESLTNVARHSGAKNVWIELHCTDEDLILSIRDDGKGMTVKGPGEKKTLGLLGMKERAVMMGGRLAINSHPGKGLTLQVAIPLKESHFIKSK